MLLIGGNISEMRCEGRFAAHLKPRERCRFSMSGRTDAAVQLAWCHGNGGSAALWGSPPGVMATVAEQAALLQLDGAVGESVRSVLSSFGQFHQQVCRLHLVFFPL